jgi:hypothetical protein
MKPPKLTTEQIERIRVVAAARRLLPTNADLAVEMGCCKRLIDKFTSGRGYKYEHATTPHVDVLAPDIANP